MVQCFRADGLQHDNDILEKKVKDLSAMISAKDAQYTRVRKERDDFCAEVGKLKQQLFFIKARTGYLPILQCQTPIKC